MKKPRRILNGRRISIRSFDRFVARTKKHSGCSRRDAVAAAVTTIMSLNLPS